MTVPTTFVQNTNLLEVRLLKSAIEGTYIDDADVVLSELNDYATGDAVEGQTAPLAMDYVADSDGWYRCVISDEAALVDGRQYVAIIDADAGADRIGHWEFVFKAKTRRGT